MLNTKFLYLLLLTNIAMFSTCFANSTFTEQFKVEPKINSVLADRIADYSSKDILLPLSEQKIELAHLSKQLNQLSNTHDTDAVYWFIRGLQQKNLALKNKSTHTP